MPEEGHYVICDKYNIWYHPSCEGLELNEIPESDISYFCKKCLNPKQRKKKDNFTVDNHTVFENGSCNYCTLKMIHVSYIKCKK